MKIHNIIYFLTFFIIVQADTSLENSISHDKENSVLIEQPFEHSIEKDLTPLMLAAYHNDVEAIKNLLDKGTSVNELDVAGNTALMVAALNGNKSLVDFLLQKGADIHAMNKHGFTALTFSLMNENEEQASSIANLLLNNGAWDDNALVMSLGHNFKNIAKRLVADPRVNINHEVNNVSPLAVAAQRGDLEMIQLLLSHHANPNFRGKYELPILAMVLHNKRRDIAQLLINAGADVNALVGTNFTLLTAAILREDLDDIQFLLKNGANPNKYLDIRESPLGLAIQKNSPEMVKLLIDNGVDVNLPIVREKSPLDKAMSSNNPAIIELLKKAGAKSTEEKSSWWWPKVF